MSTATKTRPTTIEVRDLPVLDEQREQRPSSEFAPSLSVQPTRAPAKRSFWSRLGDARYHVRSL